MLTLDLTRDHDPSARPLPRRLTSRAWPLILKLAGARVVVEGAPPATPALLACNASHKYDPMPVRFALDDLGHTATTVSKGKNWHNPAFALACDWLGSLPIASRGYILTMDFIALHRRRPSEAQYRALREHLDRGAPLPDDPDLRQLTTAPRAILGRPFDPAADLYRDAALDTYAELQRALVRHARVAILRGHHVHMYPQGSVSTRLSRGRAGAVQLALALDIPIVPVGINGADAFFRSPASPLPRAATLTLRFGQPFKPDLSALPDDFTPFDPEAEIRCAAPLQSATDDLMERINALLDPPHRWDPDRRSDGAQGTRRFV